MNLGAYVGYAVGALFAQVVVYAILIWVGGKHTLHPYRQIVGFNLLILAFALLSDSVNDAWIPELRALAAVALIGALCVAERRSIRPDLQ